MVELSAQRERNRSETRSAQKSRGKEPAHRRKGAASVSVISYYEEVPPGLTL
jgi:hypothetical protein